MAIDHGSGIRIRLLGDRIEQKHLHRSGWSGLQKTNSCACMNMEIPFPLVFQQKTLFRFYFCVHEIFFTSIP